MSNEQEKRTKKPGAADPELDETQSQKPPPDTWDDPPTFFQRLKQLLGFENRQAYRPPPDTVDEPPAA